jgi:putative DNA primase/helicase
MGQLEIRIPTKAKSKKPWTKPPFQVNGNYAKSTDPRTWTSFEEALLHIGNFDGIGFAPTEEDPYALIDLDNCRDPQTGEITAWGQKIIQQAMSYTEVSPTGTGIRIIAKGTLPPEGRKKGDIEIYNTGHYLTLTGHHVVGTPLKIHERQSEIQAIHTDVFGPRNQNGKNPAGNTSPQLSDGEILDRAFSAKNSAKIRQLYLLGDTSGYNSSSEADLALCDLLVFYTGTDLAQLDRLFRGSKLFRSEKWDAKHYADGRTYGQGVTDKALEGKTDFYSPNGTGASAHTKGKRDQSEPLGSDPDAEEVRLHIIPIRCEKAVN